MKTNRLTSLGAILLAAGASIATSSYPDEVQGSARSPLFDLTADQPVRTFDVTVDVSSEAAAASSGGRPTLSLMASLFAITDAGAEVAVTISPNGTQSKSAVLEGRTAETFNIDADSGFFAGCQDGQACVSTGTVRFELRSGAGASGSFLAEAAVGISSSDPPAGATIKVTIN